MFFFPARRGRALFLARSGSGVVSRCGISKQPGAPAVSTPEARSAPLFRTGRAAAFLGASPEPLVSLLWFHPLMVLAWPRWTVRISVSSLLLLFEHQGMVLREFQPGYSHRCPTRCWSPCCRPSRSCRWRTAGTPAGAGCSTSHGRPVFGASASRSPGIGFIPSTNPGRWFPWRRIGTSWPRRRR